jgi:putative membrane protein
MRFSRSDWFLYTLIVAWSLVMISVPLQRWTAGDEALPFAVTLGAVLQAAAALLLLIYAMGERRALIIAGVVALAAWGIEFIGSTTGFPFGAYHYTDRLQPQIGGVPILIPLAWLMMLPSAWAIAWAIAGKRGRVTFIVVTALVFTVWDLFLDPQMVGWGFWEFAPFDGIAYFGIPLTNYLGWLLSSAAITVLALAVGLQPVKIPLIPALVIYSVTWFLETVGLLVFWGLPDPGMVGAVVMAVPMVYAWLLVFRRVRAK